MIKKFISILAVLCLLSGCFSIIAFAGETAEEITKVSLKINSDIAGKTYEDTDALIEIRSDNVTLCKRHNQPIHISNFAETVEFGEVKAGRTYYMSYSLSPAEGYTLPEKAEEGFFEIETGSGVSIISANITGGRIRDENGELVENEGILIRAAVKVDGNLFQRIFGFIYDIYLKIKAWQLY